MLPGKNIPRTLENIDFRHIYYTHRGRVASCKKSVIIMLAKTNLSQVPKRRCTLSLDYPSWLQKHSHSFIFIHHSMPRGFLTQKTAAHLMKGQAFHRHDGCHKTYSQNYDWHTLRSYPQTVKIRQQLHPDPLKTLRRVHSWKHSNFSGEYRDYICTYILIRPRPEILLVNLMDSKRQ